MSILTSTTLQQTMSPTSVLWCLLITSFLRAIAAEESCTCYIALTTESGFLQDNQMFNVTFKDVNVECHLESTERCLQKCQQGFLRSTGGGDLTHKSRRSPKKIGELLCTEYNREVNNRQVGLYYQSCFDQNVLDSGTRAVRNICCTSGEFSHC